ncbi:unnamed protein product [Bemisia tabaci]|uniref:Uncharacterized protein n=1 Tax=Bemisia tabaci TaxID=7038 RepID=A0A9P0AEN3_BEMTA|nr:unnamed protein product [Bemisia tabaci]
MTCLLSHSLQLYKLIKMGVTQVETQTRIEERLFPSFLDLKLWNPVEKDENTKQWEPLFHKSKFLRSSSLNRIKQFPAYLCNQSSSDILIWIHAAKAALAHTFKSANKQFQSLAFILAVYSALFLLAAQLCAFVVILSSAPMPTGLIFMYGNIVCLFALGLSILPHQNQNAMKKRKQS